MKKKNVQKESRTKVRKTTRVASKKNYYLVLIPLAVSFIIYLVIRYLYPIPDFTADSKMYIFGAATKSVLSYRPLGYSSFLKYVHSLSSSISTVAFFQYILFAGSTIFFTATCDAVFKFSNTVKTLCYSLSLINIPFIYLANSIMTDSVFVSCTLIWLGCLIKMVYKYDWISNLIMILVFWGLLFTRYNSLIYPAFAVVAIVFFLKDVKLKVANIVVIAVISGSFYFIVKNRVKQETGANVLSGFSGWQLATNAYNVQKLVPNFSLNNLDSQTAFINKLCINYTDSLKRTGHFSTDYDFALLWNFNSPFRQYQKIIQKKANITDDFQGWTQASIPLNEYALNIIKTYTADYFTKYIIPNCLNYLYPNIEMLANYQTASMQIVKVVQEFYKLPKPITNSHIALPATLNKPYKYLFFIVSVVFWLTVAAGIVKFKTLQLPKSVLQTSLLLAAFYFVKMFFDVLAAPVVYRYVAMNLPVMLCFIGFWIPVIMQKKSTKIGSNTVISS